MLHALHTFLYIYLTSTPFLIDLKKDVKDMSGDESAAILATIGTPKKEVCYQVLHFYGYLSSFANTSLL